MKEKDHRLRSSPVSQTYVRSSFHAPPPLSSSPFFLPCHELRVKIARTIQRTDSDQVVRTALGIPAPKTTKDLLLLMDCK